jgi:dipeptidase
VDTLYNITNIIILYVSFQSNNSFKRLNGYNEFADKGVFWNFVCVIADLGFTISQRFQVRGQFANQERKILDRTIEDVSSEVEKEMETLEQLRQQHAEGLVKQLKQS